MGDSGIPLLVVVVGTTSGIRASQVSLGIFLEIRRASGSCSWNRVSISEGRKECSRNLWWSRSGEKLNLGFQGKGKNPIFIEVVIHFQLVVFPHR